MNRRGAATLIAFVLAPAAARACDIPVYQYALEHWNPDAYPVTVVHRGPMDAASREVVAALEKRTQTAPHVPFAVRVIEDDSRAGGPRLVVRLPGAADGAAPVWEGPLTRQAVAALADSPRRREIADHLLDGDAVVWVFLECGRRDRDEAAARRIREELKRPAADGQPLLKCAIVSVSRADPAEKLLVETLLSSEADLRGRDEPMAFPVFGRGRVLYALVGAGINSETVRHALDFLVGGCSCTVKRQNPGVDLLLSADWSVITPTTPEEAAAPAAPPDTLVPLTPLRPVPARAVATPTASAATVPPSPWLTAGVVVAAVLVLATGWLAVRSGRRRPTNL